MKAGALCTVRNLGNFPLVKNCQNEKSVTIFSDRGPHLSTNLGIDFVRLKKVEMELVCNRLQSNYDQLEKHPVVQL